MTVTSRSTASRKKATFLSTRTAKKMPQKLAPKPQSTVLSAKKPSASSAKKSPLHK
jgi:hypothetical protein